MICDRSGSEEESGSETCCGAFGDNGNDKKSGGGGGRVTRNECIRGTAQIKQYGDIVRDARQRWFRHVQRRSTDSGFTGQRMFNKEQ